MNQQIYTEASEWLVEFRTEQPDYDTRRRFESWLAKSPEHVRAYLELTSVWETVAARPRTEPDEVEALIRRARESATDNVVSMSPLPGGSNYLPRASSRRDALMAIALVLLLVGASAYYYLRSEVYATGIGEQRSVLLSDGSTIDLNARSKVRVRLDSRQRHIELLQGQALFRVAKDKARPFIVAADGTLVRAVGTQFDINERTRELIVTVVEGTVAVSRPLAPVASHEDPATGSSAGTPPGAPGKPLLLDAGQRLTLLASLDSAGSDQPAPAPRPVDVAAATAWTQRRLIFESTPLEDVVAEFNRNSQRLLVIRGRGLEDFHVSGAFSSTDVQPFLRFLRAQNGVEVIEEPDRIIITHR